MSAVAAPPAAAIAHPRRWPVYEPSALEDAAALLAAGRTFDYDHGEELAAFERAFAERHGRRHALALTSGTAGLLAAYFALGIEPGDEVVVPDFTFFSTATPLFLLGAVPVLCDAGCANGTVTASELEACIGPRTAAIAVTHLWGHPCDMDPIRALAARRGLAVIEDCSHAHGSLYRGRPVGSLGDVAVFSVGGLKLVSGGMGGVLLTDDDDVYARACLLANFRHRPDLTIPPGPYDDFLATGLGGNFRMSPVAAVLAKSHLDALDDLVARRAANVGALVEGLAALPGLGAVAVDAECSMGAWYDGVVEVDESCRWTRDELAELLQRAGTKMRAPSTEPLHRYPIFRGAAPEWSGLAAGAVRAAAWANAGREYPRADRLSDRWLRLPVNYLWDAEGSIVEPYVSAASELL